MKTLHLLLALALLAVIPSCAHAATSQLFGNVTLAGNLTLGENARVIDKRAPLFAVVEFNLWEPSLNPATHTAANRNARYWDFELKASRTNFEQETEGDAKGKVFWFHSPDPDRTGVYGADRPIYTQNNSAKPTVYFLQPSASHQFTNTDGRGWRKQLPGKSLFETCYTHGSGYVLSPTIYWNPSPTEVRVIIPADDVVNPNNPALEWVVGRLTVVDYENIAGYRLWSRPIVRWLIADQLPPSTPY